MLLTQKLKALENEIVYIRWLTGEAFGRLKCVGEDFIEFEVLNSQSEFQETVYLRPPLILEVISGGYYVARLIAELSHKISNN